MPIPRPFQLALLAALAANAQAQQIQASSPADRLALEGSSFTHFPLGRAQARMQTLHRDIPGGTLISGHAYRRDAIFVRGQVDAFQSDLQVTLSLSGNQPNQASATFANNVGSSATVVLPRTLLSFPATQRPGLDPAPAFELPVPYQLPFLMPPGGGTLCVDVQVFGNQSAAGSNQNLSIYLDAHESFPDGRAEQPGFRTGTGCAAPGQTAASYGTLSLWVQPSGSSRLDVGIRDGVRENGNGLTRGFVILGNDRALGTWPSRPDCTFHSTAEVWFALPGTMSSTGSLDGSLLALPLLPPGYRLWCQAGSVDLGTAALAFTDALTVVTPPLGSVPVPAVRIVNSTSQSAATGTVSNVVPVMGFY